MRIISKEELLSHLPDKTVNKGFSQIPDCVTMCYDLTTDEKDLYSLLVKNFNDKLGYAIPSWEYIKLVLNRGDGKINTTLKGLEDKGLIQRFKADGKRNRYFLKKLSNVPCIALSESSYYFKKLADEQLIDVWGVLKEVIKSEAYEAYKASYNCNTTKEYLQFLQDVVKAKKKRVVEVPELIKPQNLRVLPF